MHGFKTEIKVIVWKWALYTSVTELMPDPVNCRDTSKNAINLVSETCNRNGFTLYKQYKHKYNFFKI